MNQFEVIAQLHEWLEKQPFAQSVRCDHATSRRESLSLYLGAKLPRKGRTHQISQADIVVRNDDMVQLVVEVDPALNPKKILGVIFAAVISDNFTPSGTSEPARRFSDAVLLYVTVVKPKRGSQKAAQLEAINQALSQLVSAPDFRDRFGIRLAKICFAESPEGALACAKKDIAEAFGSN